MRWTGVDMDSDLTDGTRTSIAVVDDDASVRRGLMRVLESYGFTATTYSSPEELLPDIESLSPDCVLADLSMPGLNGLDLQRKLSVYEMDYPVVFITGHGDVPSSVQAMRGGAVDFLVKPVDNTALLDAIDRAVTRSRRARALSRTLGDARKGLDSLTGRERQVFDLVVVGYLNKQIAATLSIAEKTVKVHRARVMRKMAVRSVAELARIAERMGAMPPQA